MYLRMQYLPSLLESVLLESGQNQIKYSTISEFKKTIGILKEVFSDVKQDFTPSK
jgi:hypothetical protein